MDFSEGADSGTLSKPSLNDEQYHNLFNIDLLLNSLWREGAFLKTEYFNDLDKKSDEELIAIANGKVPYSLSARSTTSKQDVIIEAQTILHKRNSLSVPKAEKEREQKFGILNSLRQATPDFVLYSSGLGTGVSVGILFIDIDDFKSLNTRFTESIVDEEVLIPFQQLLLGICLYRGDAYRHGGEEFLVLLPNHTPEEVEQFAERLRRKIEAENFSVRGTPISITASIGIALWPQHGGSLVELIARANKAEHEAKDNGKNRIAVYEQ